MKKTALIAIPILLLLTGQLTAQFLIKLPNITKPKAVKTVTGTASSGANRQMVIDDGFTFFDAEPVKIHDAKLLRNVDIGWAINSHIRVFGEFPNRSGFSVAVSKNGKQLAKTRCEGTMFPPSYDRDIPGDKYMVYKFPRKGCIDAKKVIKGTGAFDVAIYVFNGDTDEETLLRKYKIDVHRASRVRGPTTKPIPDVAHYYISRHAEAAASILYLRQEKLWNYYHTTNTDSYSNNVVELYFNYSPKQGNHDIPDGYLRCSVNGEHLKLPGIEGYADAVRVKRIRNEVAIYSDRISAQYKRGPEYRDEVAFNQVRAPLPLGWGSNRENDRIDMLSKSGDWKCDFKIEGETVRTFRWKVAGGKVVPHAEQANGNINLYHNSFLVDTEIPAGGTRYDYRLTPMPAYGFFYGLPWTSVEGKAMAAKVPRKGTPYHVPSNKAQ